MKIEWNRVTWYSWVVAVIVFGGSFAFGLYVGMQVQATKDAVAASTGVVHLESQGTATSTAAASSTTVTYSCDTGKQIQAIYTDGSVHITTSDGKDLILPRAMSADGGRYANSNESFVFWSKGNGAFVTQTVSGKDVTTYANCTQIAAPVQ